MEKEYKFSADELESQIKTLSQKGITELYVCDNLISSDKKRILALLTKISEYAPEVFVSFLTKANIIDKELAAVATNVFCSFNIPFECSQKNGHILFDKKVYASKARVLNDFGVVFGFELLYAVDLGDNLKAILESLDFAVAQYPNHLDFPQTQKTFSENCNNESSCELEPKTTGIFSAKEIRYARDVSFACKTSSISSSLSIILPYFIVYPLIVLSLLTGINILFNISKTPSPESLTIPIPALPDAVEIATIGFSIFTLLLLKKVKVRQFFTKTIEL